MGGWPTSEIWVPHLRRGLIATNRGPRQLFWCSDLGWAIVQSTILSCRCACCTFSATAQTARFVGNPSVTRPNGERRVRCGLPVIRPEPRNLESLVSALFGE